MSWEYSLLKPWGGDEWFSLKDFTVSGLPFSIQNLLAKNLLPELNSANYSLYRFTNMIWSVFTYVLLSIIYIKQPNCRKLSVFMMVIVTFSPFVLGVEQFYRYYNLYLFAAIFWFWFILLGDVYFHKKRWLFYVLVFFSLFIHFLLFGALVVYILAKEYSLLTKRNKLFLGVLAGIMVILFFFIGGPLLKFVFELAGAGNYQLPNIESLKRGFSLAILIKPFYAIFTYVFGDITLPLESWWVNSIYVFTGFITITGIIFLFKKRDSFRMVLTAGIIPFIGLYWFLEPLTLPGMTQFEPKHALFFWPWLLYVWFQLFSHKYFGVRLLVIIPFLGLGLGIYHSFSSSPIKWNRAIKTLKTYKGPILHDPSIKSDLLFYGDTAFNASRLYSFYDTTKAIEKIGSTQEIAVATRDYKSYQHLSVEQMWNSAENSENRYSRINAIYQALKSNGFKAVDSYVNYPLLINIFKKEDIQLDNTQDSTAIIPWFFGIYYKDLRWPITIAEKKAIGFYPFKKGGALEYRHSEIYYFFKSNRKTPPADSPVLRIKFIDGSIDTMQIRQESDEYRKSFSNGLIGSSVVYKWNKRPLISGSLAYPGSVSSSYGTIYRFASGKKIESLQLLSDNYTMNIVVFSK